MDIVLTRRKTFVPKWNGNDELPAGERIEVVYRHMTTEEKNEWTRSGQEFSTIAKNLFLNNVEKITGLTLTIDGEKVDSPTPEDVMNAPDLYELYAEIASDIITSSAISEEDKKK
jgi:hypothetical protein